LSPCSYNPGESFKKATLPKDRFYISKSKIDNFVEKTIKNKSWVPKPGHYDQDKGWARLTKGASKGWK
jgi:hypothetical protein